MTVFSFVLSLVFVGFVLPIAMILFFIQRTAEAKRLTSEDEKILQDLWNQANKLESRIQNLEKIVKGD